MERGTSDNAPEVAYQQPFAKSMIIRWLALCIFHFVTYVSSLGAICVLVEGNSELQKFAVCLIVTHLVVVGICLGAAWREMESRVWGVTRCLVAPWIFLLFGIFQLVHICLAWEDLVPVRPFRQEHTSRNRRLRRPLLDSSSAAPMLGTAYARRRRYHCRGIDAVFEGGVFTVVLFYLLCARNDVLWNCSFSWLPHISARQVLWTSCTFSLLSVVLALVDVDQGCRETEHEQVRITYGVDSGAVISQARKRLACSVGFFFRGVEVVSRIWSLCLLLTLPKFVHINPDLPDLSGIPILVIIDYVISACLLGTSGSRCDGFLGPFLALTSMIGDSSRYAKDIPATWGIAARTFSRRLDLFHFVELWVIAALGGTIAIQKGFCCDPSHDDLKNVAEWCSCLSCKGDFWHVLSRLASTSYLPLIIGAACTGCELVHRLSCWCMLCCRSRQFTTESVCWAAARGETETLQNTLKREKRRSEERMRFFANQAGTHGLPPLHLAARGGATEAVDVLLHARAEPTARARLDDGPTGCSFGAGETSLMLAAVGGHDETLRRLLVAGGIQALSTGLSRRVPSIGAEVGDTVLHLAVRYGRTACVHTLIGARADLRLKNGTGSSAMALASERRCDVARAVRRISGMSDRSGGSGGSDSLVAVVDHLGSPTIQQFVSDMDPHDDANAYKADGIEHVHTHILDDARGASIPASGNCSVTSFSDIGAVHIEDPATTLPRLDLTGDIVEASELCEVDGSAFDVPRASGSGLEALLAGVADITTNDVLSVPSGLIATTCSSSSSLGLSSYGAPAPAPPTVWIPTRALSGLPSFITYAGSGALRRLLAPSAAEQLSLTNAANGARRISHLGRRNFGMDNFMIFSVLGQGNFGIVYEAQDLRSGERCALKILNRRKYRLELMVERAHNERNILKTARHPFIVRLLSAFRTPVGELTLAMELCPNGTLNDLIVCRGNPGLPETQVRKLLAEVLLALEHLHDVIHAVYRDVKPENISLDAGWHAKLIDFGLVKLLADEPSGFAHSYVGSAFYVAPEVAPSGTENYGPEVDLYALGLVSWVCLTGGIPVRLSSITLSRDNADIPYATSSHVDGRANGEVRVPLETDEALQNWIADQRKQLASTSSLSDSSGHDQPEVPLTVSANALDLMEKLTARHPKDRGTAVGLRAAAFFVVGESPPLASDEDWQALLPSGDSAQSSPPTSSVASTASSWSWQPHLHE